MVKNITLFFLLLIISVFTQAQNFANGYYNNYRWSTVLNYWVISDNIFEEYDDQGNLLINRQFYSQGNIKNETIYTYNSANQKTSQLSRIINNDTLINNLYSVSTYNTNGDLTSTINQSWNMMSQKWDTSNRITTTYNDKNLIAEYRFETYSNNEYQLIFKDEYIYNYYANKLVSTYIYKTELISSTTYSSDTINRTFYKYNTDNLLIEKSIYSKEKNSNQWLKREKVELAYQNNYANQMIYHFGNQSNTWQLVYKLDSIIWKSWNADYFNANNVMKSYVRYEWDNNSNKFLFDEEYHKVNYFNTQSFDEYYLSDVDNNSIRDTTSVRTVLYDENLNKVLDVSYRYNKGGQKTPLYGDRYLIVYSQNKKVIDYIQQTYSLAINNFEFVSRKLLSTATNIENETKNQSNFKIYPNPSSIILNIEFNDLITKDEMLYIYDLNGRLIQEHKIPALCKKFTVTNLTAGTYVIRFNNSAQKILVTSN